DNGQNPVKFFKCPKLCFKFSNNALFSYFIIIILLSSQNWMTLLAPTSPFIDEGEGSNI
ncbi:hypothetical protein GIB67_035867, partial [Kingdonia uniflora]